MADREKVIRGLECCASMDARACDKCPYTKCSLDRYCFGRMAADALALLKAQEPNPMPGAELTDAELMEKIRKAPIIQKPAADAIPVEWIKNRLNAMLKGTASAGSCVTVALLLDDWKEAANDGQDA